MTELYHVKIVEGKGLGMIASNFIKRGTLILKEEPQMPVISKPLDSEDPDVEPELWKKYINDVLSSFYKMSHSDQAAFLELNNEYASEFSDIENSWSQQPSNCCKGPNFTSLCSAKSLQDLNTIVTMMEKDSNKAEKILQIVCIYESNLFGNGIRIKIARLNHSCHPNATDIKRNYELRAISDIQAGEEIAINYRCGILVVGMRRKEIRQKISRQFMGFTCLCDICKEENDEMDEEQTAMQSKIDELIEELDKLQDDRVAQIKAIRPPTSATSHDIYSSEKCKKEIDFCKKLYKIGKEKKVHPTFLYEILNQGFHAATAEIYLSVFGKGQLPSVEFERECEKFAKAAKVFGKYLAKELVEPELWKERHETYKQWFAAEYNHHIRALGYCLDLQPEDWNQYGIWKSIHEVREFLPPTEVLLNELFSDL